MFKEYGSKQALINNTNIITMYALCKVTNSYTIPYDKNTGMNAAT